MLTRPLSSRAGVDHASYARNVLWDHEFERLQIELEDHKTFVASGEKAQALLMLNGKRASNWRFERLELRGDAKAQITANGLISVEDGDDHRKARACDHEKRGARRFLAGLGGAVVEQRG